MKEVFIIRHAKSSWSYPQLSDVDRPLNKRGLHDAPKMASYLSERLKNGIQYIYSSHATRAHTTAEYFYDQFKTKKPIDKKQELYFGDEDDMLSIINSCEEEYQSIAIFGHNPTWTYFVNKFMHDDSLDNLPTCGVVHIVSECNKWEEFSVSNARVKEMYFPKKLFY